MRSYQDRSQSQFSAKPCMVTPLATRMPRAAILRSGRRGCPRARRAAAAVDPARLYAELCANADHRLFDQANVADDVDWLI